MFFSFQRILLAVRTLSHRRKPSTRDSWEDICHAVRAVGRRCPGATCLVNGLVGHYLLLCNGYASTLHIGVKKSGDQSIDAHAWVSIGQQVVIGEVDDLQLYTPLPGLENV